MDQQQQNFLDSKTIIAIILVGVVWFSWQSYMAKKYPAPPRTAITQDVAPADATIPAPTKTVDETETQHRGVPLKVLDASSEKLVPYEDSVWQFSISSRGMGIKDLVLKNYADRDNDLIRIGDETRLPFSTYLDDNAINFQMSQSGPTEFVGRANVNGMEVTKTLRVDSSNFLIHSETKFSGNLTAAKSVSFMLAEETASSEKEKRQGKNMAADPTLWQKYFVAHTGKNEHHATSEDKPYTESFQNVSVAALSGKYFGQAIVDDSEVHPSFRAEYKSEEKVFLGWLSYDLTSQKEALLKQKFFGGPKFLDVLARADYRLEKSLDYGMFDWLAGPLLRLMKWLFDMTHNYGVAIILMTLLVRLAVMPFNIASYKSMKGMQVIQPQVAKLKEKYKDDPQTMNREMMRLMKENNANPLMGCLPMLLQLPVFFALYQVLDASVELYKAPFMLWIHDLSLKDPFFVLPVLMGITMFIQQKITPTAMDPAQARVMLMMPIVFSLFMLTLPSGLTLYIFISTLFGIIQQFALMRDKKPTTTAIEAKA